ncbi:ABC transporter ATP-binding protein [Thermotoga sp. 38H-to]|uniref:ABC transporter ATP-binding protein n=1 Tax=Thermotoga sp. 38H-to TaxID=1755812 RepID=UPI0013EDBC54|nr:ABC transporter ATP-binding protein [Thermotoga sp. 38H-to]KAF2960236.1 multidrug ABC transporter ATP-binding protein [Thermotoga sp. 38H-to]
MKTSSILVDFLKRNWHRYLFGVLSLIAVDLLQVYIPRVIGKIVDMLNTETMNFDTLKIMLLWVMAAASGMFTGRFFWRFFLGGTARKFFLEASNKMFSKLLSLTPGFFDRMKSGELMARFTNDLSLLRRVLGQGAILFFDSFIMIVLVFFFMIGNVGWKLSWISFAPLLLLVPVSMSFGRLIHRKVSEVQKSFSELSGFTEETISSVRIVKSFSVEDVSFKIFENRALKNFEDTLSAIKVSSIFRPLINLIASTAFFLTLLYGGRAVINGKISLGDFIAFNSYLGMLVWPMMAYGFMVDLFQRGRAAMRRLDTIFTAQPEVKEPEKPIRIDHFESFEVRNLTYRYPGTEREVLKNITIKINRGEMIGIAGSVGSGKSTIAKLLMKLYPVEMGKIFINGVDINNVSSENIRSIVTLVPQETFLFSDTVRNNITVGLENVDKKRLEEVTKLAAVYDDIMSFPEKFDTIVGEKGVTLSGGQKQRITITRALIRDFEVYIFDDCLSAVDPETEERIIDSIRKGMKGKTIVVITHRLKVLKNADRIYVLHEGRVIEEGTHEELMIKGGMYSRMYRKQLIEEG